jgi:hypothetical protein
MRLLMLAGTALLVVGLSGCTAPVDEATEPDAPTTSGECGGLTTEDLVGIFGVELDGPEPSTGDSDQNGVTWMSTGCDWENDAAELELDLDISVASDFPDGTINCIEPGAVGEVTPVDGIGDQAWWKFDDFNEVEGELRVCTSDRLVEFAVDGQTGSMTTDELKEKAQSAVQIVIG